MVKKIIIGLCATVLLTACVSKPVTPTRTAPPDWVLRTPAPDANNTYFVGSSSGGGDLAKATDDATANLIAGIMNYMGTRITVDSTATARATLDSYQADIAQSVRSEASGRLSGFMVKERFEAPGPDNSVIVYILAAYQTRELEKEKARIAAVFQEKIDAVAVPERAGDSAQAAGRWFDAIKFYVEAAAAAAGADIDNAAIKAERNVNKARQVLAKLNLLQLDFPSEANLGKAFPQPFRVRLVYGEGSNAPGIPGAEVLVRYQRLQANGRTQTRTERLLSDAQGIVSFSPPAPDVVGRSRLSFELNLASARELIDGFPRSFDAYADALVQDMSRRSLTLEYTVVSLARTIATGVSIIDLTDNGNLSSSSLGQGGIFETLARERFIVSLAPINSSLLVAMNDSAIYQAAKAEWLNKGGMRRYIYGTTRIEAAERDGTMWKATARMVVKCVDLENGQILYSSERTAIAIGNTEDQARRNAISSVSRDTVARDLMSSLP